MTYLTDDELAAIQTLPRDAPYMIQGVSPSVFSVARYYGRMQFHGYLYHYMPESDELVRADVLRAVAKMRNKRTPKAEPAAVQLTLGGEG